MNLAALVDDSGSAASPAGDGTILSNSWFQTVLCPAINAMFAGAGAYATFTLGGKLAVEGFGAHTFSAGGAGTQSLTVRNTTAGTTNRSAFYAGNDTSSTNLFLYSFTSSYTTLGPSVADGGLLGVEGAGGLSIVASHASGAIRFYTGGTNLRATIASDGLLAWSYAGAGAHTFTGSNAAGSAIGITASSSGTAAQAILNLTNDSTASLSLIANSTGFTTSNYLVQRGGALLLNGTQYTGGMHYAATSHTFWEWGGSTKLAILTNLLTADNGLFIPNTFSLHVGSATRVGRSTTNPTNVINLYPGTLPVGTMVGGLQVYAKDSGAGLIRLYYMDSGGTERGPL